MSERDAGALTTRLAIMVGAGALVIGVLAAYAVTLPERLPNVPAAGIGALPGTPVAPATPAPSASPSPEETPAPSPATVVVPPPPPKPHPVITVTLSPTPVAAPKVTPAPPGPPTCPPNAMCVPPPTPAPVILGDSVNGTTVHVTVGTRIEVELGSTYWSFNPPSNPSVLRPAPHIAPLPMVMCPMIPGTGCGTAAQDYIAEAAGTSVISASRVSCGEALRCTGTEGDFSVTVVVGT